MKKNNLSFVITMFFSILLTPVFGAKNGVPQWQLDINDRSKELEELQKQNGAEIEDVKYTEFPKTADDLSFSARIQLETESFVPYKDMNAYQELKNVKNTEEWCSDHLNDPGCEEYRKQKEHVTPVNPTKNSCSTKCGELPVGQGCRPVTLSDCKDIEKTQSNTAGVKTWIQICRDGGKLVCKPYSCNKGYKNDSKQGKCIDDGTTYYYLSIYSEKTLTHANFSTETGCYAVCGTNDVSDDVNKILKPILGENYCVMPTDTLDDWFGTNDDKDFIMRKVSAVPAAIKNIPDLKKWVDFSKDKSAEIRFTGDQYNAIVKGLTSLQDKGQCDGHDSDINAEIYFCDQKCNKVWSITLDD